MKNLFLAFSVTILLVYCSKDSLESNNVNTNSNELGIILDSYSGEWEINPLCPVYEIPLLEIAVDVEDRFDQSIEYKS